MGMAGQVRACWLLCGAAITHSAGRLPMHAARPACRMCAPSNVCSLCTVLVHCCSKGRPAAGSNSAGKPLTPSFPFLHPLFCLVCLLQIEKKSYYHVFKLAGFVGFDGDFKG